MESDLTPRLPWFAFALSFGGMAAALAAAAGTGAGLWVYGTGLRLLMLALASAVVGGLLAAVSLATFRRVSRKAKALSLLSVSISILFTGYLGSKIVRARTVPAIHDVSTDLQDLPEFRSLPLRADNLAQVPDQGRTDLAALDPEARWKVLHREAYNDLSPLHVSQPATVVILRAEHLARGRGWDVVSFSPADGRLEAIATSLFFRFKDDVVVRVRADPGKPGASIVDMRSVSRVGVSDVGVNASRIRSFLADLASANSN